MSDEKLGRGFIKRPLGGLTSFVEVVAYVFIIPPLVAVGEAPGHHHGAAWRANDGSPRVGDITSFLGELIEDRSMSAEFFIRGVASVGWRPFGRIVEGEFPCGDVVGVDEDDVGFLRVDIRGLVRSNWEH